MNTTNQFQGEETQIKDKPQKIISRTIVLAILLCLIVVSYFFCFSSNYPSFFSYRLQGIFSSSNYYGARSLDLIVIRPYKGSYYAEEGDIVCYSISAEKGSALVVGTDRGVLIVEKKNGDVVRISENSVVGEQVNHIAVLGLFFALYFSYFGAIGLSVILLAYCLYITFSRINYENTSRGKRLLFSLRKERQETKERNTLLLQLKERGDIDIVACSIVDGEFEENLEKFEGFDFIAKGNSKEKYKYVLTKIYNAYISIEDLSKRQRCQITNLFELMCEASGFDIDMQYMLSDLAIKTKLIDFDDQHFSASCQKFLENAEGADLVNFASVLYVMLLKNSKIRTEKMQAILSILQDKCKNLTEDNASQLKMYVKNAKNLIKV